MHIEFAANLHNEERAQAESVPTLADGFEDMKKSVTAGAKSVGDRLTGLFNQAKTEFNKQYSGQSSGDDVSGASTAAVAGTPAAVAGGHDYHALLDDQDVSSS
jgi:hypothetical protein